MSRLLPTPLFVPLLLLALPAYGQVPESIGVRAAGLGGAFTAVADDATATWWNPAGLATGALLNTVVEADRQPSAGSTSGGISAAFPALGLSYYRLTVSEIAAPSATTADQAPVRQDQRAADVRLRSVTLSQFGVTAGQSLTDHVVVASTVKLLRAQGDTHPDADIGVLTVFGVTRIGLTLRNATRPVFGSGSDSVTLRRQVRGGVAFVKPIGGSGGSVTIAGDGDLTVRPTLSRNERRVAVGAEVWTAGRKLAVRTGLSGSTLGDVRLAPSAGASVAIRRFVYADIAATAGSDEARRGWNAGLRVTF